MNGRFSEQVEPVKRCTLCLMQRLYPPHVYGFTDNASASAPELLIQKLRKSNTDWSLKLDAELLTVVT
jgi:hypothetical protein